MLRDGELSQVDHAPPTCGSSCFPGPVTDTAVPPLPRGPGLIESCGWVIAYQLAQLLAFAALATLLVWCATISFPPTWVEVARVSEELNWEASLLFTGSASLAALFLIVPLVRWRLGATAREGLGLQRLSASQVLLILAMVAPVGVLSDAAYRWGWELLGEQSGVSTAATDVVQQIRLQVNSAPYLVLLVAIALGPAIGEELVFRGLIGRGLISRWGTVGGVLLTTLLFAAAHGSPAHALGTIPVAVALHCVYLVTRSLWSAILLHGLVNTLSLTLMKLSGEGEFQTDPATLFAACGYVLVLCVLIREATAPQRVSGLVPVPVLGPVQRPRVGSAFPALAGCSIVAYTCAIVWSRLLHG
jgi:membrane protease YdiL (CAAX protease family)